MSSARVICGEPGMFRTYRFDQFVASMAQRNLWLTDAYFVATTSYVQALGEAARDGVDVRLLVPGSSDLPVLQPIVRAGYRSLVEAGIRVFEWNGSMMHAKTAVADGRWARVGSTNLNMASWATNWELDIAIEDREARRGHGGDVSRGSRQRDRDRPRLRHPPRSGAQHALPALGFAPQARRRSTAGGRRAGAQQFRRQDDESRSLTATEASSIAIIGIAVLALAIVLVLVPALLVAPVVLGLVWLGWPC